MKTPVVLTLVDTGELHRKIIELVPMKYDVICLSDSENAVFGLGCNTSRFGVVLPAVVFHEKWMPYTQQADIGR